MELLLPGYFRATASLRGAASAASWPLQSTSNVPGRCKYCFLATAAFLQRSQVLQQLLPDHGSAPATLLQAVTVASWPPQSPSNAPRHCNCCFGRPLQRSGNATRRCKCCSLAIAALLKRFRTLQLLLDGHATLLQRSQMLELVVPGHCNAPAQLLLAGHSRTFQLCATAA